MRKDEWLDKIAKEVNNLESPVDSNLWSGIQAQIVTPGAAAASSGSIWTTKLVASIIGTVTVGATVTALIISNNTATDTNNKELTQSKEMTVEPSDPAVNEEVAVMNGKTENDTKPVKVNPVEIKKESKNLSAESTDQSESNLPEAKQDKSFSTNPDLPKSQAIEEKSNPVIPAGKGMVDPKEEIEKSKEGKKEEPKVGNKAPEKLQKPTEQVKPIVEAEEVKMDLVNVFTPNDDGVNDWFIVETSGLTEVVVVVMDSKNKVVWRGTSNDDKWNGRDQGGYLVPPGNYLYYVTGKDSLGELVSKYQRLDIRY